MELNPGLAGDTKVTVHTGGKPPRSCQGESKTGPKASQGQGLDGNGSCGSCGKNRQKNKWKQDETRISKLQMERLKNSSPNSAYFTLHNA